MKVHSNESAMASPEIRALVSSVPLAKGSVLGQTFLSLLDGFQGADDYMELLGPESGSSSP